MKLWKTKNADGATAAICCMTREYAEAVMSGADDLDHEGNCAVADKNLEFAYLVELLHQKKQGVTVDYLLSVAEEFDIKLSETSLHIYCQPFTVGRYMVDGQPKYFCSKACAVMALEEKGFIADGYSTSTISLPVFVLECLQDGRIASYNNTYIIGNSIGERYVSIAPIGAQEEAMLANEVSGQAISEIMRATGLPLVMNDNGGCRFVRNGTVISALDTILTSTRATGAYLLEP